MKKISNFSLSMLAMFLLIGMSLTTSHAQVNQQQQPFVEVQANAQREVTPDELYLSIIIKESDYKGKKSIQEMQKVMVDVLKKNKVDVENNLTLSDMGSSVNYKAFSSKVRPRTEATYRLKLSDVETMQSVIADLETKEISNIEMEEMKYSKYKELQLELCAEAAKAAKIQATSLAEAMEQSIGAAIYINSWMINDGVQPRPYMYARSKTVNAEGADMMATTASQDNISVNKIKYTVNINAKFELFAKP